MKTLTSWINSFPRRSFSVVVIFLFLGCQATLYKPPPWPKTKPLAKTVSQVNSPCGEKLKSEPKSVSFALRGKSGVWISEARARCLFARAKIGRVCREECGKLTAQYRQSSRHIQDAMSVSYKNSMIRMQQEHKRKIRNIILASAGIVLVFALVGYGLGKL